MATARSDNEHERAAREAYLQLASAADRFECYENPHATRIAAIADRLAQEFHLAPHDRKSLRSAAHMHDLGEVAMEREYIQRAGSLMEDERLDLTRHPVIGEQEVARASADRAVQLLVRWHHEWWNGCGYPDGLSRNEIPFAARILRIADSYAALTDARPYRPALSEDEARHQMREAAGIEFDPIVLSVFLSLTDMEELRSFDRPVEPVVPLDEERPLFSSFT